MEAKIYSYQNYPDGLLNQMSSVNSFKDLQINLKLHNNRINWNENELLKVIHLCWNEARPKQRLIQINNYECVN